MLADWSTWSRLYADPTGPRGVETVLRAAIRAGDLPDGFRLPSSRSLAAAAGVARGTVTAAFAALIAEGHLVARIGSGTMVSSSGAVARPAPSVLVPSGPVPRTGSGFDLRPGVPAVEHFPREEWLRCYRRAVNELPSERFGYPEPGGAPELRAELAGYLSRVRGLRVGADSLIITGGVSEGVGLVVDVLRTLGLDRIGVESPSHAGTWDLLRHHGFDVIPIHTDDRGIDPTDPALQSVPAVLVTPAHQFPLGVAMAPERRAALLGWVRSGQRRWILEDDYDAEFRYDGPAVGSLQGLEPTRVIHLGSGSKALSPALRLGHLVATPDLLQDLLRSKYFRDLGRGTLDQVAMAHFLATGGYHRHLRRMRRQYRTRRDALVAGLDLALGPGRVHGLAAGLHLVLPVSPLIDDQAVTAALAGRGVRARALSEYHLAGPGHRDPVRGLVLGYTVETPDRLVAAAAVIGTVLRPLESG